MIEFTYLGYTYRTNEDASIIEGNDRTGWNRTYSSNVRVQAIAAVQNELARRHLDHAAATFAAGAL